MFAHKNHDCKTHKMPGASERVTHLLPIACHTHDVILCEQLVVTHSADGGTAAVDLFTCFAMSSSTCMYVMCKDS